jgi:hypothetical protein
MRSTHCILCSNGAGNLRGSSKHCDCFQSTCDYSPNSGLSRCPSCNHFTVAMDEKSDYKSAHEEEQGAETSNFFPGYASKFYFNSTKTQRDQKELNDIGKQIQGLKEKEEELMAKLMRRQKRDKVHHVPPPVKEVHRNDYAESVNMTPKKDQAGPSSSPKLTLECVGGPHCGESVHLTGTLVIGSKPVKKAGKRSHRCALKMDGMASPDHAKLVLTKTGSKKKPILTVKVTDLNSANGTKVNNRMLPKGSSRQAFVRDRIQVGESVFRVLKI